MSARSWGEQLLRQLPSGALAPLLATEWHSSPDAKAWVFKIRKGVQFHNGKELTPDDVRRDGDTVIFTMNDANADFPFMLTDFHLQIQPNGGKNAPAAGIGTGPYKLVSNEPGQRHLGTRMVVAARGELNAARRKQMYRDIALIAHEEGGAIIPMFNDTIDAIGPKVGGWVDSPVTELMCGMASSECWVEA